MAESESDKLGIQVAKLRSDVEHIQADVTDIKADLRATRVRFDNLDQKIDSLREKTADRFDAITKQLGEMKVWALLLYGALAATLLGVMTHGFKWI